MRKLALHVLFYYLTDLPKIKIPGINREAALADARIIAERDLKVTHLVKRVRLGDEGRSQILLVTEILPLDFVVEVPPKLLEFPHFDLEVIFEFDFRFTMTYLREPIKEDGINNFLELK